MSRYVIAADLIDPCRRCGEAHDIVLIDARVQPCLPQRWTRRFARRLAEALARVSTWVGGQ